MTPPKPVPPPQQWSAPPQWIPPAPEWAAQPGAFPPDPALQPIVRPTGSHAGTISILLTMVLLLVATAGSWIYVHHDATSSASTVSTVGGQNSNAGTEGSVGTSNGVGVSGGGSQAGSGSQPTASQATPLDRIAVGDTMEAFMTGMQNHDLVAVRKLVCPRFRSGYTGTYVAHGYAYGSYSAEYLVPVSGQNYASVIITVNLVDPNTGARRTSETHTWAVERDDGNYHVCGYTA